MVSSSKIRRAESQDSKLQCAIIALLVPLKILVEFRGGRGSESQSSEVSSFELLQGIETDEMLQGFETPDEPACAPPLQLEYLDGGVRRRIRWRLIEERRLRWLRWLLLRSISAQRDERRPQLTLCGRRMEGTLARPAEAGVVAAVDADALIARRDGRGDEGHARVAVAVRELDGAAVGLGQPAVAARAAAVGAADTAVVAVVGTAEGAATRLR